MSSTSTDHLPVGSTSICLSMRTSLVGTICLASLVYLRLLCGSIYRPRLHFSSSRLLCFLRYAPCACTYSWPFTNSFVPKHTADFKCTGGLLHSYSFPSFDSLVETCAYASTTGPGLWTVIRACVHTCMAVKPDPCVQQTLRSIFIFLNCRIPHQYSKGRMTSSDSK